MMEDTVFYSAKESINAALNHYMGKGLSLTEAYGRVDKDLNSYGITEYTAQVVYTSKTYQQFFRIMNKLYLVK